MNNNYMSTYIVDKVSEIKKNLKAMDVDNIESVLKKLTEQEKDVLLKLYVYENK